MLPSLEMYVLLWGCQMIILANKIDCNCSQTLTFKCTGDTSYRPANDAKPLFLFHISTFLLLPLGYNPDWPLHQVRYELHVKLDGDGDVSTHRLPSGGGQQRAEVPR